MKKVSVIIVLIILVFGLIQTIIKFIPRNVSNIITPLGIKDRPLDAYTIDNLGKRTYQSSQIVLDSVVSTSSAFTSYIFRYASDGKKVTGFANVPNNPKKSKLPVIIQLRGYVDQSIYESGIGTKRSSEVYVQNGFVTLAPDFLGYGGSDMPENDIFEERFETYTAVMNLLASLKTLPFVDTDQVFLWGHSNGGHIGLTTLTIYSEATKTSQLPILKAATFWAPVTRTFPYSILYYTDEAPDSGKILRKKLADFESTYDTDLYAFPNYLERISVPIQIHQGTSDDAVPSKWSDDIVKKLKAKNVNVDYYIYPGADHNLSGTGASGWNTVVDRDIKFFLKYLHQ
jgi:uncharacterized protein